MPHYIANPYRRNRSKYKRPVTIIARYPGYCDSCRKPYAVGDRINGTSGAYCHERCVHAVTVTKVHSVG